MRVMAMTNIDPADKLTFASVLSVTIYMLTYPAIIFEKLSKGRHKC